MISKRLIVAYILDWIFIIIIAAIGGGFYTIDTYQRPFSLVDLHIAYPFVDETIPVWLLVVVALVIPAGIIFLVCLVFVPGRWASKGQPKKLVLSRKLWEWNTSWMGLALSCAIAFMISQGMKNVFGKPRPNLLGRCDPDTANVAQHIVSGNNYASEFNPAWVLVGPTICRNTDTGVVMEGFRSFPSAHAAFSWAGLLYLSFFLASKFAVSVPFAPTRNVTDSPDDPVLPVHRRRSTDKSLGLSFIPHRNRAAAPPVYLIGLPLIPICGAIYITASRFFDFYHDGWDLIFGSLIGIIAAYFAFRWYHMPISSGAGWSWGPRSRDRAFIIGVGRGGYVGEEGWGSGKKARSGHGGHVDTKHDISASNVNGNGANDHHALGGVAPTQNSYEMEPRNGYPADHGYATTQPVNGYTTTPINNGYSTTQANEGFSTTQPRREYGAAI